MQEHESGVERRRAIGLSISHQPICAPPAVALELDVVAFVCYTFPRDIR